MDELNGKIQKNKGFWRRDLAQSPEFLVARWKKFVRDNETEGHTRNWLIDDYWQLLESREAIHKLGIDDLVSDEDRRFRVLLISTEIKHKYKERKSDTTFGTAAIPKMLLVFFMNRSRSTS